MRRGLRAQEGIIGFATIVLSLAPSESYASHERRRIEIKHTEEFAVEVRYREVRILHGAEYRSETRYREIRTFHPAEYRNWIHMHGSVRHEHRDLVRGPWTEVKREAYQVRVLAKPVWVELRRERYEQKVLVKPGWTEVRFEAVPHAIVLTPPPAQAKPATAPSGASASGAASGGSPQAGPVRSGPQATTSAAGPAAAGNRAREVGELVAQIRSEQRARGAPVMDFLPDPSALSDNQLQSLRQQAARERQLTARQKEVSEAVAQIRSEQRARGAPVMDFPQEPAAVSDSQLQLLRQQARREEQLTGRAREVGEAVARIRGAQRDRGAPVMDFPQEPAAMSDSQLRLLRQQAAREEQLTGRAREVNGIVAEIRQAQRARGESLMDWPKDAAAVPESQLQQWRRQLGRGQSVAGGSVPSAGHLKQEADGVFAAAKQRELQRAGGRGQQSPEQARASQQLEELASALAHTVYQVSQSRGKVPPELVQRAEQAVQRALGTLRQPTRQQIVDLASEARRLAGLALASPGGPSRELGDEARRLDLLAQRTIVDSFKPGQAGSSQQGATQSPGTSAGASIPSSSERLRPGAAVPTRSPEELTRWVEALNRVLSDRDHQPVYIPSNVKLTPFEKWLADNSLHLLERREMRAYDDLFTLATGYYRVAKAEASAAKQLLDKGNVEAAERLARRADEHLKHGVETKLNAEETLKRAVAGADAKVETAQIVVDSMRSGGQSVLEAIPGGAPWAFALDVLNLVGETAISGRFSGSKEAERTLAFGAMTMAAEKVVGQYLDNPAGKTAPDVVHLLKSRATEFERELTKELLIMQVSVPAGAIVQEVLQRLPDTPSAR